MTIETQTPVEAPRRYLSLRAKLILGFTLLSAFVSFITARGMYTNLQSQVLDEFKNRALGLVELASLQLDGDEFQQITSDQDENYEKIRLQNLRIRSSDSGVRGIFTMRKDNQGIYFVVDAGEPGEENIATFGERYADPSEILVENFDTMTDAIVEAEISTDQDGSFLSAYAPILTSDSELVGVIGVDILADTILQRQRQILLQAFVVFLIALGLGIFFGYVAGNALTEPVIVLIKGARAFAVGKLDQHIEIRTRDEVEDLSKTFNSMADEIRGLINGLEMRVAERTKELQEQTLRLRTSAEIARDAASSHNLSELLDKAVNLIQERFELYHTGIFLVDNNNDYAILTASPTSAGKQMIANNYKLRVGEVGIVGRVAATGEPRITLDTGSDAVQFNNPLLPRTRSQMALPLKVENRMIGVLDVQSDQQQAFDENDIAIMQILADQLATAIERTRLLQQVEQNLSNLEQAYGQFTRESWKTLGEAGLLSKAGYRFDNIRIQQITEVSTLGDKALQTGTILMDNAKNDSATNSQVAIPIKLRGQTIGVVTASLKDGYAQTAISTLELAIERLAVSLESARLYEEARLRADRERTIAQVTSNISSATEFDAILRTTVEEVGKSLGDSTEVSIQIINETDQANR
jgi:GAF domain-containing protein/HAMP domain-containing protein